MDVFTQCSFASLKDSSFIQGKMQEGKHGETHEKRIDTEKRIILYSIRM